MSKKEEIRKGYACPVCNANFPRYGMVGLHLRMIHEELNSFDCSHCGMKSTTRQSMNKHIAAVHEEKKQFTCSFCNGNYASQAMLYTHILKIHEGEKPYKCSICEYSCTRKAQLKIHISSVHRPAVHEKKEPYEFTVSHSNSDLNGHARTVHESMKLFKCPFCSIKHPKQSNIKKHIIKVHEKEKALKGEKKVRDEKRKAIDDKLLDPNASESASKRSLLEA